MRHNVVVFIVAMAVSGLVAYGVAARASISSTISAVSSCAVAPNTSSPTSFTGIVATGAGLRDGINSTSGAGHGASTTCGMDSIDGVRDMNTPSVLEVDGNNGWQSAGTYSVVSSTTASACAQDWASRTAACGNSASSGSAIDFQLAISDLSQWTGNGDWYKYVQVTFGYTNQTTSPSAYVGATIYGLFMWTN